MTRQVSGKRELPQYAACCLQVMESTGLGSVLSAVLEARREGWRLEIDPTRAGAVRRIIEVSGVSPYLWPNAVERT